MKHATLSVYVPSLNIEVGLSESMLSERASDVPAITGDLLRKSIDYEMESYYATANTLIRMACERYAGKSLSLSSCSTTQPDGWDVEKKWVQYVAVYIYNGCVSCYDTGKVV